MRRLMIPLAAGVLCVALGVALGAQGQAARDTLDIYFIDTEGGQATLYVSPSGQTLLVDTGNAGARDRDRILEVVAAAGVTRVDHLLLTHYHGDHYGNLIELATRLRAGHLYDHGASIEADRPNIQTFEALYAGLARTTPRTIVVPGDAIPLGRGVDTTIVVSHSRALAAPLARAPGAGAPNGACADFKARDEAKVDPDNHYSAVMIANLDEPAQLSAVVGAASGTAPGTPASTLPAGPAGNSAHAPAHYLKVSARADGSFTVTNSRNGYAKTYAARP